MMARTSEAQKVVVLFEDKGTANFFERLRGELGLERVTLEVGGGWTKTYRRYEQLAQHNDPMQIVPILDADTITKHAPSTRAILRNPNKFRFSHDFEWAFCDWMLADAITLFLESACAPLSLRDGATIVDLEQVVRMARNRARATKTSIYSALKAALASWLNDRGIDPTSFPLPEKARLANVLGSRLAGLHVLPHELEQAACRIQHVAGGGGSPESQRAAWSTKADGVVESTVRDLNLSGRILLTINGRLHALQLPGSTLDPFGPDRPLYFASWSPNFSKIAAIAVDRHTSKRTKLLILSAEGVVESEIDQGVPTGGPNEPCWHPNGQSLLVKHNGPVLCVTVDGERWSEGLGQETGAYCQAHGGFRARTVQGNTYRLELGRSWAKLSPVEGARDVRGWISWSHAGDQLAFTEYQLSGERGCVAVVGKKDRRTAIVTPLASSPYWVSWSPNDRFVAFSCLGGSGGEPLRVINVATGDVRSLLHAESEIVMGCRAWAP